MLVSSNSVDEVDSINIVNLLLDYGARINDAIPDGKLNLFYT